MQTAELLRASLSCVISCCVCLFTGGAPLQGQDAGWTKEEDELLAAVVHEFGENYRLVSDVMSPAAMVTGVFRNAKACAERFKKLAVGPGLRHTAGQLQRIVCGRWQMGFDRWMSQLNEGQSLPLLRFTL